MTLAWTDDAVLERMRGGWDGGVVDGTRCGIGSIPKHLANIVEWIPAMAAKYGFVVLCDAGAGDMAWLKTLRVQREFFYRPFDLVPRHPDIVELDITKTALPACDVILCRAVLIHLDPPRIHAALALFRQSAPYLMATTERSDNVFDPSRQCNPIDLASAPYRLGAPIETAFDLEGPDSILGLWRI